MSDDITKALKTKMTDRMNFLEEQLAVVAEMLIISFMTMKKDGGFSDRLYKKMRQMMKKYLKIRMKKVET